MKTQLGWTSKMAFSHDCQLMPAFSWTLAGLLTRTPVYSLSMWPGLLTAWQLDSERE